MNDVHETLFWMKPQGLDAKFPAGRMGVEEAEMIDDCIHWDTGSAAHNRPQITELSTRSKFPILLHSHLEQ